ncbi:hypothetical protein HK096_001406, partial [Nowakowskiella sp. JEL0078]
MELESTEEVEWAKTFQEEIVNGTDIKSPETVKMLDNHDRSKFCSLIQVHVISL